MVQFKQTARSQPACMLTKESAFELQQLDGSALRRGETEKHLPINISKPEKNFKQN